MNFMSEQRRSEDLNILQHVKLEALCPVCLQTLRTHNNNNIIININNKFTFSLNYHDFKTF